MDYQWKSGQDVFIPHTGWSRIPGAKATIDRVTPSGRAIIGGTTYDKSGRRIGGGKWCVARIEPFTKEHEKEILTHRLREKVKTLLVSIMPFDLTEDQIDTLIPVLERISESQKQKVAD